MPASLLKLLSLLAMVPGGLKTLGRGAKAVGKAMPGLTKAGWGKAEEAASTPSGLAALAGGAYFGNEILNQFGAGKQRDISRAELALQEKLAGMSAEATKLLVQESRAGTEKSLKETREIRKEDLRRAQEDRMMEMFLSGQQNQVAMLLQAAQGMAGTPGMAGSQPAAGGGITGILRSNL
jgi:hypothetical protein